MHFDTIKLKRIANAARALRYAHKVMPGDDLGQKAVAACIIELDAAIAEWDHVEGYVNGFDAKEILEKLITQVER